MANIILLGTSRIDITPPDPIPLAGFSFRQGPFESVHTPLELRCFVFRYPERDVILLSADLIWWGSDTIELATQRIKQQFPDVNTGNILFLATHNHCGPQVSRQFSSSLGECDEGYLQWFIERVVDAVAVALTSVIPVQAFHHWGHTDVAINRRLATPTGVIMAPNPDGERDNQLHLIDFVTASGESAALLVCANCHPTTSADNRVDKEFLMRGLDLYLTSSHPHASGCLIQGCCGDLRPNLTRHGAFYRGNVEGETEEFAQIFAEDIRGAHASTGEPLSFEPRPHFHRTSVDLPFQADFPHSTRSRHVDVPGAVGEWARHFSQSPVPQSMTMEMVYWRLSKEFQFLFFSEEMVQAYASCAWQISQGHVWCGAYCGPMHGYVATADQIAEGGYESYDYIFYFLQPGPLSPSAEQIIIENFRNAITKQAGIESRGNVSRPQHLGVRQ